MKISTTPDISNSALIEAGNNNTAGNLSSLNWSDIKVIGDHGYFRLFTAMRYGRKYFLKCPGEKYRNLPEYRRLLFKEFELGIQLDHPGIARTVAWEDIPGIGEAIVTEFIDGVELQQWLGNRKSRDKKSRLNIVRQIADALVYIHSAGISHRDLKPDNVLVTHKGDRVKIIDFGLGDSDDFTVYKESEGTKSFGAPEQMAGNITEASMSADIYAFGKIIELMLPGYRYRRIARRCLNNDAAKRPSATEVAKWLTPHNNMGIALLVTATAAIVTIAMIGIELGQTSTDSILPTTGSVDTVYIYNRDTVTVEIPGRPMPSAIKAVWDKTVIDAGQQIETFKKIAELRSNDRPEVEKAVEDLPHQWGEYIYYKLLEIGCSETEAQTMRDKLEKYILDGLKQIFDGMPHTENR